MYIFWPSRFVSGYWQLSQSFSGCSGFLLLQSNDKAAVAYQPFQRQHSSPNQPIWLIPRPTIDLHMQAYSHASNQTVIV